MTEGFVNVEGGRLFYEEAGSGRAVVFVHPGLWDRRAWDDQVPVFAERFRTIRYDVRGYGKSTKPEREYSNVEDLYAMLTYLGVERAAVIGCSMGGQIAIDFTLEHPEMVTALIPVAAGLSGYEGGEEEEKWEAIEAPITEALKNGDIEGAIEFALALWAPLGTDDPAGRRIGASSHLPRSGSRRSRCRPW
jgi:pimeloyl-ACP methyl ester carboxylesterase